MKPSFPTSQWPDSQRIAAPEAGARYDIAPLSHAEIDAALTKATRAPKVSLLDERRVAHLDHTIELYRHNLACAARCGYRVTRLDVIPEADRRNLAHTDDGPHTKTDFAQDRVRELEAHLQQAEQERASRTIFTYPARREPKQPKACAPMRKHLLRATRGRSRATRCAPTRSHGSRRGTASRSSSSSGDPPDDGPSSSTAALLAGVAI